MTQKKRSSAWIVLHTLAIIFLGTSVFTGLRIATVSRPELLVLSPLLPQGFLHGIHFISASGVVAICFAYVFLHAFEKPQQFKRHSLHFWVTQFGYINLLLMMLSGILLFIGAAPYWLNIHFFGALGLLVYFGCHALLLFIAYGAKIFPRLFISKKWTSGDAFVLFFCAVIFTGTLTFVRTWQNGQLYISKISIDEFIEIDGYPTETVWQKANALTVQTYGGANFKDGATPVTIQAVHNGLEAFFHVTWVDPTKSLKHLPLEKLNQGWRVLENGFYQFDEQTYYEDKFAIMLAESCEAGASGTAHLGPKPLTDKPANWHGKGFHYSKDGNIRDIWHWKAVRTNDMFIADDNFFGLPDIARPAQRRYTAGYLADGKESGAYIMNWQWYSNQTVLPKRLPEQILLTSNYSPANWVTPWYDTQPYQPSLDSLDEGSLLPSVLLYSNRYEGDRADVRARGEWNDGRWSLELVRPLTTTSEYDVGIETGICLWVSAFDQSQIAHTRHARPLLIRLGN